MEASISHLYHRRATRAFALTLLIAAMLTSCAMFQQRPVKPISDVVDSAQSGASSDQIIAEMRTARTTYALRGSDFSRLAELGVPEAVLDELQQSFFADVEFQTRRWYANGPTGGPTSQWPQPLDLDNLAQGGNGMGPTDRVGKITHGTRPQGVPEWVPAYPPLRGPRMPVNTVVEMTSTGKPTQEIVETVNNSRVDILYADDPRLITRFRVPAVTGSMYARFAEQGVDPEVLDALQAVYISQHIEDTRKRVSKGVGGPVR
ncbi:MAG: hypothetical protein JSU95_14645 [Betaproteobacteria bacterium]|nr:MAG: hypothetical protein JSU95_14645 [Betaproteobacteria bacterium]